MTAEQAAYLMALRIATRRHRNAGKAWLDSAGLRHIGYASSGGERVSEACGRDWQSAVSAHQRKYP